MVDVYMTRRYRGKTYKDEKLLYRFGSNTSVFSIPPEQTIPEEHPSTVFPPDLIIEFNDTAAPTVTDYDTEYQPTYGRYPKLMLLVYDDDNNELESIAKPIRTIVENLLTTITWDLPEICSGKIIISK